MERKTIYSLLVKIQRLVVFYLKESTALGELQAYRLRECDLKSTIKKQSIPYRLATPQLRS
jgi:hypothetical protein